MDVNFDPYLKWLGIPPRHQPPNAYRLLGIELFEADPDVIANAADQRMAHLKNFAAGKYSKLSQKLLNEIAAARVILLNAEQKIYYDAQLHQQLTQQQPPVGMVVSQATVSSQPPQSVANTPAAEQASAPNISPDGSNDVVAAYTKRRHARWLLPAVVLGVTGTMVIIALVMIGKELSSRDSTKPTEPQVAQGGAEPSNADSGSVSPTDPATGVAVATDPSPPHEKPVATGSSTTGSITATDSTTTEKVPDWTTDSTSQSPTPVAFPSTPKELNAPQVPPLTAQIDLLKLLAEHRDDRQWSDAAWRWSNDTLISLSEDSAELRILQPLPAEYDLRMVVRAKDSINMRTWLVPRVISVSLDRWCGDETSQQPFQSGVEIAGKPFASYVKRPIFGQQKRTDRELLYAVRRDGVVVIVDGQRLFYWPNDGSLHATKELDLSVAHPVQLKILEVAPPGRLAGELLVENDSQTDVRTTPTTNADSPDTFTPSLPARPGDQPPSPHVTQQGMRAKLPVPSAEEIQSAKNQILEIYRDELNQAATPQEKGVLARRLRAGLTNTQQDGPAVSYVLLEMASSLATEAGEMDQAFDSIDQLAMWFKVNVVSLKAEVLTKIAKATGQNPSLGPDNRTLFDTAQSLAQTALHEVDLPTSERCLRVALSSARKTRDRRLTAVVQKAIEDIEGLQKRQRLVEKAEATLKTEPDDPNANRVVGAWYCLVAGQWAKGLPLLAKGSDEELAKAARLDLANPTKPLAQVRAGDCWWDLSENEKDLEENRLRQRAVYWYRQAEPQLTGLAKRKLEKRLEESGVEMQSYALEFDGISSYLMTNFLYSGKSPITIEAIVKPEMSSAPVGSPFAMRSSTGQNTIIANGWSAGLILQAYYGQWCMSVYQKPGYRYERLSSSDAVSYGEWVHVAGVYDGQQARLYIDGRLQASEVIPSPVSPSPVAFVIGAGPKSLNTTTGVVGVQDYFRGQMRAVRISSTARYTKEFEPPETLSSDTSTALLLPLTAGSGDRVADASGHKNVFAVINGAKWVEVE